MQFILIPHYILHCRQCPGSVIIQLFRNKTPVAVSSYGTKIGRRIFSACRINYSFVQRSNTAFKLCRRDAHHPRKHRFPYGALPKSSHSFFATTALSFSLLLCATPPLRYLLPIGNISKGGICRAPRAPPLSRCRLLQRRYQRTEVPMHKHRHSALRYCPYIRQQGSFLPSYPHLYLPL